MFRMEGILFAKISSTLSLDEAECNKIWIFVGERLSVSKGVFGERKSDVGSSCMGETATAAMTDRRI